VTVVLDASAVLALIYRESGHDQVASILGDAVVCTVNWAEVVAKLAQRGHPDPAAAVAGLRSLGVHVRPFAAADAVRAGLLWQQTRAAKLSLGDRACLAVAAGLPDGVAVTSDRTWAGLDPGCTIRLIR
jgi:PIN domain nuclease of toxin-antitoxin system